MIKMRKKRGKKKETKITKADMITVLRLFLTPVVILLILSDHRYTAGAIYFLAALTDAFDGYIARKYKEVTDHGGFLDALIDRIFVISIFVVLVLKRTFSFWITFLILLIPMLEIIIGVLVTKKTKRYYLYYIHRNSIRTFAVFIYICLGLYIIEFIYADYFFIASLFLGLYAFIDYIIYLRRGKHETNKTRQRTY